jgi:prepilin-type N-terminal cleavage/methylation domain-containing protein
MRIISAQNRKSPFTQLAYTLIEVLVAASLLGILFVSLYGGMSSGFAITRVSRENLRATQILLERMEGIRLYNWNQLVYSNWVPTIFTNWYYPMTNAGELPGIMYTGRMRIIHNPALNPPVTYSDDMAAVIATVNWTSAGIPRTRTMTTYVGRYGVQNYVYNSTNYISISP